MSRRIVHAVELAGGVMEELAKGGPRQDVVAVQCQEFMQVVKEIQTTLRYEIKSMCEYRPYEHSHYPVRTTAESSVKKLDSALRQIGAMQATVEAAKPA